MKKKSKCFRKETAVFVDLHELYICFTAKHRTRKSLRFSSVQVHDSRQVEQEHASAVSMFTTWTDPSLQRKGTSIWIQKYDVTLQWPLWRVERYGLGFSCRSGQTKCYKIGIHNEMGCGRGLLGMSG